MAAARARDGTDLEARTRLLEGAAAAGQALAERGLYLGHAMAQAVGGRYGIAHGASNALCLPPAMRFNAGVVPSAMTAVPVERVEELSRLAGYERLRDLGVPEEDIDELGDPRRRAAGREGQPSARDRHRGGRVVPLGLVATAVGFAHGRPPNEEFLMPRNRLLTAAAVVVGVALIVVAAIYWAEPAKSLPGFFPGHEAGSGHHHTKHGIAALVVGLAVLAFAWF